MSTTICWRQVSDARNTFAGTSSQLAALTRVFGDRPTLGPADCPKLWAMYEATLDSFYKHVAEKIHHVGAIEVWGEQ